MSDPIITRALVEHYLRATGWQRDELDAWVSPRTMRPRRIFTADAEYGERWLDYAIDTVRLAMASSSWSFDVAARLALCAAAELLRSSAESARANRCPENDATADQLDLEIEALLLWAGVDPKRWEDSRHG